MSNIKSTLQASLAKGISNLYEHEVDGFSINLQPTRKEFEGEFTFVVFPLLRYSKKNPEQTATDLGEWLMKDLGHFVEAFSVIKGFLNIRLKSGVWLDHLQHVVNQSNYGFSEENSKEMVMVEYSSPNTNKPLHLGHLRNNFLGYSVAEILKAAGHPVKKVQIINDRGIHICKSMVAWQKYGEGETPDSSGMKGDHLVGKYYVEFEKHYKAEVANLVKEGMSKEEAESSAPLMKQARETLLKWEDKDPDTYALWQKMNGWVYKGFDETYKRMGVDFDKLYYESETWSIGKEQALEALENGKFYRKEDGSVWVDLTPEGLDEKIILRKDGTAVYMTQDIGTAILRFEDFPELKRLVYTVGNEQEYHFKVLFLILEKLGYEWAKNCYHLSYGMVELPEGKMKSREGTVVDADDLMASMVDTAREITTELGKLEGVSEQEREALYEEIGMGALKYFLLRVDPKKNMLFDPKESIDFNGHTGPFIQYAHARIQSVLRNYGSIPKEVSRNTEITDIERRLQLKIFEYPEVIAQAASEFSPAVLSNYIYDLTKEFGTFYQNLSILQAETDELKQYRVCLASAVGSIIKSGMGLLGIGSPDRM
jgi:arginyl-tRNA synthetase